MTFSHDQDGTSYTSIVTYSASTRSPATTNQLQYADTTVLAASSVAPQSTGSMTAVDTTNLIITTPVLSTANNELVTVTQGVQTITAIVYRDGSGSTKTAAVGEPTKSLVTYTDSGGSAVTATTTVYPSPSLISSPIGNSASSKNTTHQSKVAVAIAVPIGSVAVIGVALIFFLLRRKRKNLKKRLSLIEPASSNEVDCIYPEVKCNDVGGFSPYR